jgi:hypothetical protein
VVDAGSLARWLETAGLEPEIEVSGALAYFAATRASDR